MLIISVAVGIGVFLFVFRMGELIAILYADWNNPVSRGRGRQRVDDSGQRSENYWSNDLI